MVRNATEGITGSGVEKDVKIRLLVRKADALVKLGRIGEARRDLEAALNLDPNNKTIKENLDKLEL